MTDHTRAWSAIFAMALAAFALIASEFMPVSLLTPIARDFGITEGGAGKAIALSGFAAMATSLCMARLARRFDRKSLLAVMTVLIIISGTVVAGAPNTFVFMVGRVLIGVAIGGFWSLTTAVAMQVVSQDDVPRALAVINGGNALASVLAAPIGSFLGSLVGWRWAFFSVIPLAIVALAWQWRRLPSLRHSGPFRSANPFGLLRQPRIVWGMAGCSLFFMGQFTLFTYLRPFLEQAVHVSPAMLSALLFLLGASGLAGTMLIGRVLTWHPYRPLFAIPLTMAVLAVVLARGSTHLFPVGMALALWGLVATAAPVGWWSWIARAAPDHAEAGGGLMVAVVQMAITFGATVGGIFFDAHGYAATYEASALLLVASAGCAFMAVRSHASPAVA